MLATREDGAAAADRQQGGGTAAGKKIVQFPGFGHARSLPLANRTGMVPR
jgi:hypothetical protein